MNTRLMGSALLAATLLAACGGGHDSAPAEETPAPVAETAVPLSAMASPAALMKYARAMQATSSDNAEPLALPDAAMPVSDDSEPEALD